MDLLFDIYLELNEFYVSRFAVGHTHADLDRFFGYLIQILFGTAAEGKPFLRVRNSKDSVWKR